jgi:hypothetical protein
VFGWNGRVTMMARGRGQQQAQSSGSALFSNKQTNKQNLYK